ncbi:CPBP family intramembrane metalloprotease [Sphingomonas sp. PAMC26645]|uniref:CPBP family intramembrane glutamic endopeptidase n=1 Tax=Sphingomonas sp. PAMC26645 TaxID=2565555 RepID=UPI00109D9D20|nr:type II CAAX endopeptidase family protein [Sphingomonas sp. PAMC26645]QCB43206.1 CPBP family intramembrane metalloprotease [Sphingomonas sp. PAMC26645]
MSAVRPLAGAAIGVVLVAVLLAFGPPVVAGWLNGTSGASGESLFTLAIFGPMLAIGIAGWWLDRVTGPVFGKRPGRATVLGLALGAGGLALAVGYTWLAGSLVGGAGSTVLSTLLLGIVTVTLQVGAEEMLFRGWLQPQIASVVGAPVAVLLVAVLFAALHLLGGATGVMTLANLTLGGILFGLIAVRDGGIAGAIAAHWGWNVGEQMLLGLDPNPGVGAFGALFDLDLVGAARWGGSDQGLNASLAMTIALAAIVIPLALRYRRAKPA